MNSKTEQYYILQPSFQVILDFPRSKPPNIIALSKRRVGENLIISRFPGCDFLSEEVEAVLT